MVMSGFPKEWMADITVTRPPGTGSGQRDRNGDVRPGGGTPPDSFEVKECLVAPTSSTDPSPTDPSDSRAALYTAARFVFREGDKITVPPGHVCHGTWDVEGRPAIWPEGVHLSLRRRA